jgi:hypothetical protein
MREKRPAHTQFTTIFVRLCSLLPVSFLAVEHFGANIVGIHNCPPHILQREHKKETKWREFKYKIIIDNFYLPKYNYKSLNISSTSSNHF